MDIKTASIMDTTVFEYELSIYWALRSLLKLDDIIVDLGIDS